MITKNWYIARDKDGALFLHGGHPVQDVEGWFSCQVFCHELDKKDFPEIKAEECFEVKLTVGNKITFEVMG